MVFLSIGFRLASCTNKNYKFKPKINKHSINTIKCNQFVYIVGLWALFFLLFTNAITIDVSIFTECPDTESKLIIRI